LEGKNPVPGTRFFIKETYCFYRGLETGTKILGHHNCPVRYYLIHSGYYWSFIDYLLTGYKCAGRQNPTHFYEAGTIPVGKIVNYSYSGRVSLAGIDYARFAVDYPHVYSYMSNMGSGWLVRVPEGEYVTGF
jgi:hypothetical protein